MGLMRLRRTAVALAAGVIASVLAAVAPASATPGAGGHHGGPRPSACRPANHLAKITQAPRSAGHHHYRVTITAPRGYASCTLAGSPVDVRFTHHGKDSGLRTGRYGKQGRAVVLKYGHPVHFDIQLPTHARNVPADSVGFTLRTPKGEIPGTSFADGKLKVARGTLVGPVRAG
ncbi:DUF4232 domain-containing protein [Streptomyces sp. NRRL F-5630]|uniref:DUF4232 domain-containing protein n=1 Tax=Streptomyces sp. NRRL F-5630 TaxID=1463864 RepID=UPI003EBEABF4